MERHNKQEISNPLGHMSEMHSDSEKSAQQINNRLLILSDKEI